MTLPPGYQKRLQRFDRWLRMRWSESSQRWLLERKAAYARIDVDPATLAHDTFVQMRDGFFTLSEFPPRGLPQIDRLITALRRSDTWNMGMTSDDIASYMDDRDAYRREAQRKAFRAAMGDLASESYDDLAWYEKRRVTVPGGVGA